MNVHRIPRCNTFILKIFNSIRLNLWMSRDCPMGSTRWENNHLAVQKQTRYEETIANTLIIDPLNNPDVLFTYELKGHQNSCHRPLGHDESTSGWRGVAVFQTFSSRRSENIRSYHSHRSEARVTASLYNNRTPLTLDKPDWLPKHRMPSIAPLLLRCSSLQSTVGLLFLNCLDVENMVSWSAIISRRSYMNKFWILWQSIQW
jgi:hypothetical protein